MRSYVIACKWSMTVFTLSVETLLTGMINKRSRSNYNFFVFFLSRRMESFQKPMCTGLSFLNSAQTFQLHKTMCCQNTVHWTSSLIGLKCFTELLKARLSALYRHFVFFKRIILRKPTFDADKLDQIMNHVKFARALISLSKKF